MMSEKAPTAVVGLGVRGGYGGYRAPPFTEVQLKELEQQAMIYKYLVAGLPVPPDLVRPIRHSFEGVPSHILNHPALGYCSYFGKKFDPEPGRCRRTDGKKWRCSKDAHPDSKYCERHMHRGRNRSRKPVESQSTPQSSLTAVPLSSTGVGINCGSSQQMSLYCGANSEGSSVGSNATKLQMGPISYGIDSSRDTSFSHEATGRVGSLRLGPNAGSSMWGLMPSQVSSSSMFKLGSDTRFLGGSFNQQYMTNAFEPINASSSKQQQNLFGSDMSSPPTLKQEHLFFSEWPTTKESWSNLDNNGSNQNVFSSTQLSMSIPRASSDFAVGTAYSTNGELSFCSGSRSNH